MCVLYPWELKVPIIINEPSIYTLGNLSIYVFTSASILNWQLYWADGSRIGNVVVPIIFFHLIVWTEKNIKNLPLSAHVAKCSWGFYFQLSCKLLVSVKAIIATSSLLFVRKTQQIEKVNERHFLILEHSIVQRLHLALFMKVCII